MASTVGNSNSNSAQAAGAGVGAGKIGLSEDDKKRANLRVLQRIDKSVTDIVGSNATHVVLYEFNQEKQQWEKRNVEGSLFLTRRSADPPFKLTILNRSSRENFEVTVTAQFQMQIREPYLIFRETKAAAATAKIRGIWFHDGQERTTMAELLQRAIAEQVARNEAPQAAQGPVPPQAQSAPVPQAMTTMGANHPPPQSSPAKTPPAASPVRRHSQQQQEECAGVVSATAAAVAHMTTTPQESEEAGSFLDKKNLQLALLSLLQEDKFLDLIHAQYVKVARARQNQRHQPPGQQS